MTAAGPTLDVHVAADAWRQEQVDAARRSLADEPRWLDPVWFYDEHGSELFDAITRLPEYYPTRAERALLVAHAAEIAAVGADVLVELGSGTSDKTTVLLDAMVASGTLKRYVPFDVSEETLRAAADELAGRYPSIDVHGVVGDFHHHLGAIPSGGRRLVAFLGSTIGNLRPDERRRFLLDLDCVLDQSDRLLLGIDLVKDPARMVAAYDDATGVTAAFNRNALRVVNGALGADFDPDAFHHVAVWNEEESWMEMRLRARSEQVVVVPGMAAPLRFAAGDELRTEISAKFTVDTMTAELGDCGFAVESTWTGQDDDFALVLARPQC